MTTQTRKRVRGKPEARREQILAEALRLIGRRGYYGFSIRELAQRCQLTDPGVLHYFGSKEKLLIALLEDCDRRGAETVRAMTGVSAETDAFTFDQVRDIFRAIVERNRAQPELVRLYAMLRAEAMNADHPAHAFFMGRQAKVLENFAFPLEDYVPDARSTALQLLSIMWGLEMEWMRAEQAFDLLAEWDRAFERLVPTPPPAR
jgi:AcrR family transcriptional regulator